MRPDGGFMAMSAAHGSSCELVGIPADILPVAWDDFAPWLAKALERGGDGTFSLADIYDAIYRREMQLWGVWRNGWRAATVTQIIKTPQQTVLLILLVGGEDMADWLPLLDDLCRYGKENGADMAEICGRHGWRKWLPDWESQTVLRRAL